MKFISKLKNAFNRLPSKATKALVLTGLVIGLGVPTAITVAEFYPDRKPFDYSKPCNPDDADIYDRCGSLTGPVFNSFINTPSYGDERAFVDARRTDQNSGDVYKNVLPDVTEGSKEVEIRMYVHNNANQSTNESGLGIARNTKVRVDLPEAVGKSLRARGYISADNASPSLVEDTVDFVDTEDFQIKYVPGSAKLFDNDNFSDGVKLSDNIVTSGAPIGTDALDGNMKGCFEYEAVVTIRVQIETIGTKFTKQVSVPGQGSWGENVTVNPGDKVSWLLSYQNTGEIEQENVNISDKLPPHLEVVPESVKYIDAAQEVVQNDEPLFGTGGINFDNWLPNGGFYVRFDTVAKGDFEECQVTLRNIAYNHSDQTQKIEDSADVKIVKENCVPDQPLYSCDLLTADKIGDRKFKFTTTATAAGGATIKQYVYDFGDGTDDMLTDKAMVEHTYAKDGDFTARVTVHFTVDGETKTDTDAKCTVNISTETQPETPTELPKTGPADMIGLFAATTVAAGAAHRFVWAGRKRF